MKKNTLKSLVVLCLLLTTSKITIAQWIKLNPIDSFTLSRGTTFTIGDTMYVGNGDNTFFSYSKQFRGYTVGSNTWNAEPTFPGGGGDMGFSFVINDTAYVGDGANPSFENDLWAFTPSAGWISKAAPPGGARAFCVGFSIGNKGYFGTGDESGALAGDFYEYNPSNDSWVTKANIPLARTGGVGFSANGKGYIGLGSNNTGTTFKDMWRYDPITDTWTEMAPLPDSFGMEEPGYFVLCNKLIVTLGDTVQSGTSISNKTWMYDPSDGPIGKWYKLPDFPGVKAFSPQGFSFNDTGYISGGWLQSASSDLSQMWKYMPNINPSSVSANATINQGQSVILTADGGGAFKWLPITGLSDSVTYSTSASGAPTTTTASPLTTTTYTITEAVCGRVATVVVTVITTVKSVFNYNANGSQVNFSADNSTGNITRYHWNFGDGDTSNVKDPVHTFLKDTIYTVCLTVFDSSDSSNTICKTLTIANAIHCSAYFKLLADSANPHHWFALNESIGKSPITYAWQWGDGTSGVGDTASHVYSAAGYYTICLTVTDDSACTNTWCDSSAYLYRTDGSNTMVYVNVVNSILLGTPAVKNILPNNLLIIPDPCSTCKVKGIDNVNDIVATDVLGRKVNLSFTKISGAYAINFSSKQTGMFLLHNIKTGEVVKFIRQ